MDIIQIDPDTNYPCSRYLKSKGFTSLMYLVYHTREHPEYHEQIKYILDNNPEELNKQNDKKWTALMISCRNSNRTSTLETVRLLLEYNPDVNIRDVNGRTAIWYVLLNMYNDSNTDTCRLLLDHDADINIVDICGYNILMDIIYDRYNYNKYVTTKYILENTRIDLEYKKDDKTVYDIAVYEHHGIVAKIIKTYQDNSLDTKCALD